MINVLQLWRLGIQQRDVHNRKQDQKMSCQTWFMWIYDQHLVIYCTTQIKRETLALLHSAGKKCNRVAYRLVNLAYWHQPTTCCHVTEVTSTAKRSELAKTSTIYCSKRHWTDIKAKHLWQAAISLCQHKHHASCNLNNF